jgi:hypothetical protein
MIEVSVVEGGIMVSWVQVFLEEKPKKTAWKMDTWFLKKSKKVTVPLWLSARSILPFSGVPAGFAQGRLELDILWLDISQTPMAF